MDKKLREKVVDLIHWKEYKFVGQGNMIFEGSLTQESEEYISDRILEALPELAKEAGWQPPEEVRRGKEAVREAFRFPKPKGVK